MENQVGEEHRKITDGKLNTPVIQVSRKWRVTTTHTHTKENYRIKP